MELALAGLPQVAMYKTSKLTTFIIQEIIKPDIKYVTVPNLLADEHIIPECLLGDCAPHVSARW